MGLFLAFTNLTSAVIKNVKVNTTQMTTTNPRVHRSFRFDFDFIARGTKRNKERRKREKNFSKK